MAHDWVDEEPGIKVWLAQTARLLRRGLRRPIWTVSIAVLTAAITTGVKALKEYKFGPRYTLRVVEGDRDPSDSPQTKRLLRQHVEGAIFSNGRLNEVMERHNLYPGLRRNNPRAALDSFREDISVDVYRNYFLEAPSPHRPPRSARIAVRYYSSDRDLALAVTRDLGSLIADHEARTRKRLAEAALARVSNALQRAQDKHLAIRQRLAEVTNELARTGDAKLVVEQTHLLRSLEGTLMLVEGYERRKASFSVGTALETHQLGVSFEVIDPGAIPNAAGLHPRDLIQLSLTVFVLMLPLAMLAAGAFDTRLRELDDIQRLGLDPLGRVPAET